MARGRTIILLLGAVASCLWTVQGAATMEDHEDCDCHKTSVFANPSVEEMEEVIAFLKNDSRLNITDAEVPTINSTYIFLIDGMEPYKIRILAHRYKNATAPARRARVVLYRGDLPEPRVEEWKVGPLGNISYARLIRNEQRGEFTFDYKHRSFFSQADLPALYAFIAKQMEQVDDMLETTTGYRYNDCGDHCLNWLPGIPGELHTDGRKIWIYLLRKHEGYYVHPIGFQFRIDAESLNPDEWRIDYVWFRGQRFIDLEAFSLFPYSGPDPLRYSDTDREMYSVLDHRGDPMPKKEGNKRGPQSYMPDGNRFEVKGHQVEWQGWKFDFAMRSAKGLRLYDVTFMGERLAYEISLAELGVIYGDDSPVGMHEALLDSQFLLGLNTYELYKDLDCPQYAEFFDFAHYLGSRPVVFANSACLFEYRNAVPLRRHYESDHSGGFHFAQGMPDNALILRSILSVYNYEYIMDFMFHQNGAIEVVVSLSGYIWAHHYYSDDQAKYGFQVFPEGLGVIHQHLVNFKVDLDVIDILNNFETLDMSVKRIPDPTERQGSSYVHTFDKSKPVSETTQSLNSSEPKYLVFYNSRTDDPNANNRGYRLYPVSTSPLLLPEGRSPEKLFSWARHPVTVTQRKDDEESSTSIHNAICPNNPPFYFADYINTNEDIRGRDEVAWVTLGVHHLPHSEDLPIVQTPGVQLKFYLLPYNFFPEDPSLASRDNIRVNPDKDGKGTFKYAGTPPDTTCAAPSAAGVAYLVLVLSVWTGAAFL